MRRKIQYAKHHYFRDVPERQPNAGQSWYSTRVSYCNPEDAPFGFIAVPREQWVNPFTRRSLIGNFCHGCDYRPDCCKDLVKYSCTRHRREDNTNVIYVKPENLKVVPHLDELQKLHSFYRDENMCNWRHSWSHTMEGNY